MKFFRILLLKLLSSFAYAETPISFESSNWKELFFPEKIYIIQENTMFMGPYKKIYKTENDLISSIQKATKILGQEHSGSRRFYFPSSIKKRYKWFGENPGNTNFQKWLLVLKNKKVYYVIVLEGHNKQGVLERFCGVFLIGSTQAQFFTMPCKMSIQANP